MTTITEENAFNTGAEIFFGLILGKLPRKVRQLVDKDLNETYLRIGNISFYDHYSKELGFKN